MRFKLDSIHLKDQMFKKVQHSPLLLLDRKDYSIDLYVKRIRKIC